MASALACDSAESGVDLKKKQVDETCDCCDAGDVFGETKMLKQLL